MEECQIIDNYTNDESDEVIPCSSKCNPQLVSSFPHPVSHEGSYNIDLPIPVVSTEASTNVEISLDDIKKFKEKMNTWAVDCRVAQNTYTKLLGIIKDTLKIDIPRDARTILKTPQVHPVGNIIDIPPGCYYHFGLEESILDVLKKGNHSPPNTLHLVINIDGLPLTKSSSSQFWPILGKIENLQQDHVFPIGVYHGFNKPSDANDFLKSFVDEFVNLSTEGISYIGKKFSVTVTKVLCDAPAKAYILCVKNHNAYFGCTKCITEGNFINNRMTYPDLDSPLRTDTGFRGMVYEDYHKTEASSMLRLNIDMVDQIPLDYMHLVCLGVMKRLLIFWVKGNRLIRLSDESKKKINEEIKKFRACSLVEFARKPRALEEVDRWKASEFRLFLLYYGPVVLKNSLNETLYLHFLCLHCAIRIMASPELCCQTTYLEFADVLLRHFVEHFGEMYGYEFVNHNVHNLIHLKNDVSKFGNLDKFSCFCFENYMHVIKMSLKSTKFPLQHFIKQVRNYQTFSTIKNGNNLLEILKPLGFKSIDGHIHQLFGALKLKEYTLKVSHPDCYFILKQEMKAAKIVEFHLKDCVPYVVYKRFTSFRSLFNEPCSSELFYCGIVGGLQEATAMTHVENILCKCLIADNLCLSLIH